MDFEDPSPDYTEVVDSVMRLFGEVMSRDAICAIVEHCGGDLTQSIDIIVNMSDENAPSELPNTFPTSSNQTIQPSNYATTRNVLVAEKSKNTTGMQKSPPTVSYAGASKAKASPGQPSKQKQPNAEVSAWTLQTRQIVGYHQLGSRTLILLRGLPGSGKTSLARQLVQVMCPDANYNAYVFSTDDFFMHRGRYEYNKSMLSEAHYWNQNRVREVIGRGVSPIFVDNTNVEVWEMEPYVKAGVSNGYIIEVLEPNTPWAKKANQLVKKNSHDVPFKSIRRMLDMYQNGVSGVYLIRSFGLSYPADKIPPVIRNFPPFLRPEMPQDYQTAPSLIQAQQDSQVVLAQASTDEASAMVENISSTPHLQIQQPDKKKEPSTTSETGGAPISGHESPNLIDFGTIESNTTNTQSDIFAQQTTTQPEKVTPVQLQDETISTNTSSTSATNGTGIGLDIENTPDDNVKHIKLEDLRKQLEQIEKLEAEWENGDDWNNDSQPTSNPLNVNASAFVPKPPRNTEVDKSDADRFLPSTSSYNDWSKIALFMPAWNEAQCSNLLDEPIEKPEMSTKGTYIESSDTDDNNTNLKIIIGTPRDINVHYMQVIEKKIPNKRMLDKSSMTNDHDHVVINCLNCPNIEKHFVTFRNMFKNISKVELRDIFDKCLGDVNWAMNIVLDGRAKNELQTIAIEDVSDTEDVDENDETNELCKCLSEYDIVPSVHTQPRSQDVATPTLSTPVSTGAIPKMKKDNISESSMQLKRQIEQNVVISDSHYSQHCLKIRKMRRGEVDDSKVDSIQEETEESVAAASSAAESTVSTDDEDSQTTFSEDCEKFVNVDLGVVFVSELDGMFGRGDMIYPENIVTRVNLPLSLLNEINAIWIESFMYQLDQQSRQSEIIIRQDEEFARQLALKEEQLAKAGQEPAVPDLKDIMDMELALSIYKKEITAEWRNNEPNDLAARMTREKLYNLFPDVQPEILSELLMAHDCNFQATVEVLLSSTGNGQILEEENGVAKFIAKKELERHEKLIEEQKKALSEVEWPLLPKDLKVDMKTVQEYRAKASQHLAQRNMYYQRAQSYMSRDMTQIATYYSDVAVLHTKKYDHANSMAAASLMQMHAANSSNNATIDLHFLHVPEAKESLDLFLDTHIQRLRESQGSGGPRFHTLFFITGRGLHSHGGPKIKPAVKRRLRERSIAFHERNPGLLSSKVYAEDKMTYELP